MRMTRQRQVILEVLKRSKDHPTADDVYDRVRKVLPKISLGTVYRNLENLTADGVIDRIENAGGQNRFDPTTTPHNHFRCVQCGRVEDLPFEVPLPEQIPDETWTRERKVIGSKFEYYGLCSECYRLNAGKKIFRKERL